jgi:hypothetical protein
MKNAIGFRLPARAGIVFAAVVLGLGAMALAACGGGGDGGDDENANAQSPTPIAGTPTPTATEAGSGHRMECGEIINTPFQSPEEAAWYRANCARFDGPPVAEAAGQPPIGDMLVIPSQGVNTPVHRASVPESGAMPDPIGYFNAVWYDFSKFESYGGYANAGNLVLSGHVDCARCINGGSGRAVFWGIRNLKEGDTAQYLMANGETLNYVVVSSEALSVNSDWATIVASSTADMTLITCTGTFTGGEYTQRHVVGLKLQS